MVSTDINSYVLGILWSLGRYSEDVGNKHFFLRHNREYFLQIVKNEFDLKSNIHTVLHKNKTQYRLKVSGFDIVALELVGWQARNAEQRSYPNIQDGHRDFIRAYLEIHSAIDTITIQRKTGPRTGPRLRIYGNKYFLEQMTEVLATEVGAGVKRVQQATRLSEVSGILYYQSTNELQRIFEYVYSTPVSYFDREYYENYKYVLTRVGVIP